MTSSTLNRLTKVLVVGAMCAGTTTSAAGAMNRLEDGSSSSIVASYVGSPPDVRDAASALSQPSALGVKADGLRLQAIARAYQSQAAGPDVLERYAAAHPYGTGVGPVVSSTEAIRPPDIRDAAEAARFAPLGTSSGFDWNDYAIGLGSGMGFVLLLAGGLAIGRHQRHQMQTA
jgi:hypothetical protein